MKADNRNLVVVGALIGALTAGAALLLWLEPAKPRWQSERLLRAERRVPIEAVEVDYLSRDAALAALEQPGPDSIGVVFADERPAFQFTGPRLRLLIVQSVDQRLAEPQQENVLATLAALAADAPQQRVSVSLAESADPGRNPTLPAQAHELRDLLTRKGLLADGS
jgi:hypothetical protein